MHSQQICENPDPQRWAKQLFEIQISLRHAKIPFRPVLRFWDVYPGSEFFHSGFMVKKAPDL
jgi:hypothetical protein